MITTSQIVVNQAAVSAALGVSHGAVADLERKGIVVKHGRNQYDLIESTRRYIRSLKGQIGDDEGTDYYAERARLTKAQADERELKILIQRGELIPIKTAESVWCDAAITLRNNILSIPNKLSHVVAPLENTAEIAEEIKKELIATLESVKVEAGDYKVE